MKNAKRFLEELSKRLPPPPGEYHTLRMWLPWRLDLLLWVTIEGVTYRRQHLFTDEELELDPLVLAEKVAAADYRFHVAKAFEIYARGEEYSSNFCVRVLHRLPEVRAADLIPLLDNEPQLRQEMIEFLQDAVLGTQFGGAEQKTFVLPPGQYEMARQLCAALEGKIP